MPSTDLDMKRIRMGFMLSPQRLKVMRALYPDKEAHSSQLEEITKIERQYMGLYLAEMHMYGIVTAEMRVIEQATKTKKCKAGQFYKLTEFGRKYWEMIVGPILEVISESSEKLNIKPID